MNHANGIAMAQEPETYIKTAFDNIFLNYSRATRKAFGRDDALWKVFEELSTRLQDHLSNYLTLKIKWSVGRGSWAHVPWIACLDNRETDSSQDGVYPVYLFREDLSGVYLALNQGIASLKEKYGTPESRRILRKRAEQLRLDLPALERLKQAGFSLDNKIDLHSSPPVKKNYEASIIAYKFYPRGEISDDAELLADLDQVLRVYDQYLEQQPFREIEAPAVTVESDPPPQDFRIASAIHEVISYIEHRGFIYEPWQIAQYVTAVRTKPFVILAGITGVGKSKLPSLVAEATGGESNLVPVRPDWTDSAEVLGYTDLEGNFRPGSLLEIAYEATANSDQFFTCIIDEMNLARVEQYFPEVLSKIEDRRPQQNGGYRTKPLIGRVPKEADGEWGEVGISENLAIVGTVNMDESTHDFSRKVLDRAFTIELSEIDLARWKPNGPRIRTVPTWPVTAWNPIKIRLSELIEPTGEQLSEINRAITALQDVNRLLAPAQLQVAYRTRDEIAFYLLHARQIADAFVDRDGNAVDPLDLALQMKILPRIIGRSNAIRRCLLDLLGWAHAGVPLESEEEANSIMESWEALGRPASLPGSKYPRLAARLCLMWQRFETDGCTSYWL
jgi:hypothetical protein